MVAAQLYLRLEMLLVTLADRAVDAVGGHDQIGVRKTGEVVDFVGKLQLDPELVATILQDHEQGAPLGAAESVAGGAHDAVVKMKVDLVPGSFSNSSRR